MKQSDSKYAARYAKAIFGLASEKNIIEKVNSDIETLDATFRQNPILVKILTSFSVSAEKRRSVVTEISDKAKFHKYVANMLLLVIKNRRASLLPAITEEFIKIYRSYKNIATVDVVSAKELTQSDKKRIADEFAKSAGFEAAVNSSADETILGGLVITYRSRRIDDSLKTKLERLKKTMKGTA